MQVFFFAISYLQCLILNIAHWLHYAKCLTTLCSGVHHVTIATRTLMAFLGCALLQKYVRNGRLGWWFHFSGRRSIKYGIVWRIGRNIVNSVLHVKHGTNSVHTRGRCFLLCISVCSVNLEKIYDAWGVGCIAGHLTSVFSGWKLGFHSWLYR